MKRLFGALLATLIFSLMTGKVIAGGGPVAFRLEPSGPLNPGEQYIVHAQVYLDGPYPTYCKNCKIELKLKNPQSSDYIAQSSDKTDDEGRIYAKVISKISGNRELYANVWRIDGTLLSPNNSSTILRYTGLTVDYPVDSGTVSPQYNPGGTGVKSGPVRLPAVGIEEDVPTYDSTRPEPDIARDPNEDNQDKNNTNVDELNQKVAELESQLEESKKQQGILEERINGLVNFIKNLFPFFK